MGDKLTIPYADLCEAVRLLGADPDRLHMIEHIEIDALTAIVRIRRARDAEVVCWTDGRLTTETVEIAVEREES